MSPENFHEYGIVPSVPGSQWWRCVRYISMLSLSGAWTLRGLDQSTLGGLTIQERACVNNLHSCNNARLYTAYSAAAYHALRKLHLDLLQNAISSGNFESVYDELLTLIHLFKADTNRGPFD